MADVYVVVKLSPDEWQQIYREEPVLISSIEAVLSADEVNYLNVAR